MARAGLRGDLSSIRALKANLRAMPISLAHSVAQRAAPAMTDETQSAFSGGRTVYGEPRPSGADGKPLTLVRTGDTKRALSFVATGTLVWARLGTRYARYLIGKYSILPNGPLPAGWSRRLRAIVAETRVQL